jgi:hypothetical protein
MLKANFDISCAVGASNLIVTVSFVGVNANVLGNHVVLPGNCKE